MGMADYAYEHGEYGGQSDAPVNESPYNPHKYSKGEAMNFQAARLIKGQKDPQNPQFELKVAMNGTFGDSFASSLTKNQKPQCKIKVTDDNGETRNVNIFGNDQPTAAMTGQRAQFMLSAFDGVRDGKSYESFSGFWQSGIQVPPAPAPQGQQQPAPPQQPPPPRQPAPQGAQPVNEPVDWDGKQQREFRSHAVHSATLLIVALAEVNKESRGMSPELVVQMAETYVKYVYNGREAVPNNQSNANPNYDTNRPPPPTDSDIPF